MSEPEFPLCDREDPRVPVVVNMLRKSMLMGGNFTLDARRILAALDQQQEATGAPESPAAARSVPTPGAGASGGTPEAQEG